MQLLVRRKFDIVNGHHRPDPGNRCGASMDQLTDQIHPLPGAGYGRNAQRAYRVVNAESAPAMGRFFYRVIVCPAKRRWYTFATL